MPLAALGHTTGQRQNNLMHRLCLLSRLTSKCVHPTERPLWSLSHTPENHTPSITPITLFSGPPGCRHLDCPNLVSLSMESCSGEALASWTDYHDHPPPVPSTPDNMEVYSVEEHRTYNAINNSRPCDGSHPHSSTSHTPSSPEPSSSTPEACCMQPSGDSPMCVDTACSAAGPPVPSISRPAPSQPSESASSERAAHDDAHEPEPSVTPPRNPHTPCLPDRPPGAAPSLAAGHVPASSQPHRAIEPEARQPSMSGLLPSPAQPDPEVLNVPAVAAHARLATAPPSPTSSPGLPLLDSTPARDPWDMSSMQLLLAWNGRFAFAARFLDAMLGGEQSIMVGADETVFVG